MFCTKCGTQALEGARFCRVCGNPFPAPPAEPTESIPATPNLEPLPATVSAEPVATIVEAPVASYSPPAAASPAPLHAPYAGFWLRFVAYLIDSAIVGVVFAALVAAAVGTVGLRAFRGFVPGVYDRPANPFFPVAMMGVLFVLLPVSIVASWLYFAYMESSAHQGTLGKMALGLFVTDTQGRRVTFARATGRFFAKFITGLIPLLIGYIMAGFTEKRQALHDMIASCLVLKKV